MTGSVTVGILSYRRPGALRRCLESLWAHTECAPEIHIINQGFLDAPLEKLYRSVGARPGLRITYLPSNVGCARGRRLLVESSQRPYLFFADDDLVFTRRWDRPLLELMEGNQDLGAVSPYLKEGWKTPWVGRFAWCGPDLELGCYTRSQLVGRGCLPCDFLPGGCVLVRRSVFDLVSFDEKCQYDLEDLDLWLQLRNSRWQLGLSLESTVYHRRPSSLWSARARRYDAARYDPVRLAETRQYFLRKWKLRNLLVPSRLPPWWLGLRHWLS